MKSATVLPLVNLPVGRCPKKSRPYGGKSAWTEQFLLKWLFPASKVESPKMKTAGTLCEQTTLKNMKKKKKKNSIERLV
ncbi:hypothetical protein QJS04_geneDACA002968 [Acorus gramineus]|uniref:Uncharacterized protein n=1 Tax=Acorus gramineus TaxID=55184 RepID=A0AAV9BXU9_ACOGR|nr:hypothetical protein QJS04_geneDACA002968 [Acorus gramineus]